MKNSLLVTLVVVLFSSQIFAQTPVQVQTETEISVPTAFLGISSGINNMNGMFGVTAEVHLIKGVTAFGAAGIGGWGTKSSIGIKYYKNFPYQTYFGVSYSIAGGMKDFKYKLDTESPGGTKEVTMDLNKAKNVNVVVGYGWKILKNARFHLEFGYSVPLQDIAYDVTSNHVLSEDSENFMSALTPGGLILGLGFSVGF